MSKPMTKKKLAYDAYKARGGMLKWNAYLAETATGPRKRSSSRSPSRGPVSAGEGKERGAWMKEMSREYASEGGEAKTGGTFRDYLREHAGTHVSESNGGGGGGSGTGSGRGRSSSGGARGAWLKEKAAEYREEGGELGTGETFREFVHEHAGERGSSGSGTGSGRGRSSSGGARGAWLKEKATEYREEGGESGTGETFREYVHEHAGETGKRGSRKNAVLARGAFFHEMAREYRSYKADGGRLTWHEWLHAEALAHLGHVPK